MKLIDYVIQNAKDIQHLINSNNFNDRFNMSIEEFIVKCYCPSEFECLENTIYKKPYKLVNNNNTNIDDCEYIYPDNEDKCSECWNREILI